MGGFEAASYARFARHHGLVVLPSIGLFHLSVLAFVALSAWRIWSTGLDVQPFAFSNGEIILVYIHNCILVHYEPAT